MRVHGGAVHPNYLSGEPSFDRRSRKEVIAKRLIAEEAVKLVGQNASVFLDAGTTCQEIGIRLMSRSDLILITYSVPLLMAARSGQARILCIGGELREVSRALVGALAQNWMKNLHFQIAFIAASGLSEKEGASATVLAETAIKNEAIERSQKAILVADSSKWNRPETIHFADWNRFEIWITDNRISHRAVRRIQAKGVQVIRAVAH